MPAKTFEVDFGVVMSNAQADGGVAQLVETPVGGVVLPEGVGLPVRERA